MIRFVGLDVSQKLTAICVVDETGRRLWRGQCATDPEQIERTVRGHAGDDARIGIETGPMTPRLNLWCMTQMVEVECQVKAFSADALGHRPAELGHPVQYQAADLGFGVLGRQSPGAKAAADDGFVAEHCRFRVRSPAVAGRLLPFQAPFVPDYLDVLVALAGRSWPKRFRRRSRWKASAGVVPAAVLGTAVERGGMITVTGGSG